jgi:T-complex protein 1 subunit alpha
MLLIAMPKKITNAKIALIDFNLNKQRMALGVQVVVTDPSKVEDIKQRCARNSNYPFN